MEVKMDIISRMKELATKLNKASEVYYQGKDEIMGNFEYDKLYDELLELEKESGIVLTQSPTNRVGYEVLSALPKETHQTPMLSLDKTKDVEQLVSWLGDKEGLLSWKMDGLTIVLTYSDTQLVKAVTRGNGQVGEVITNNAKVFKNIPFTIPFKGKLVLRGEAVISYPEFERINNTLNQEERYKNPRNLCSGSVRQLNNQITAKRNVEFFAFSLVEAENIDFDNSQENKMKFLKAQGFDIVEYKRVNSENLVNTVKWFSDNITSNDYPSDGLVLIYDDIAYGDLLGHTSKFPRHSIAFKWADETAKTKLLEIEWSASRTGLINPIAIFEPVELEGTTVSRASVHNLSIAEQLQLGMGDTIKVYKANMIIPQIAENLTRSSNIDIPKYCPVCGMKTSIHEENGVKVLVCENKDCLAKKIKSIAHFVSREAMNIDGLSEATIEKLVAKGLLHELAGLFNLDKYKDEITEMEGFGKKSFENLIKAAKKARKTTVAKFVYSLGIPNTGLSNAKAICRHLDNNFNKVRYANKEELIEIDGIGEVIAESFVSFFTDEGNQKTIDNLLKVIEFEKEESTSYRGDMAGINFVITGKTSIFANRNAVKEIIEARGGKVTGSVTSKTNFLINNDITSNSSKNKKAKEIGIPIITEEEFIKKFNIEI